MSGKSSKVPRLLLPVSEHYTGRVTWRGGSYYYPKVKAKFVQMQLLERVKEESPFNNFFEREPLAFSGALIHQLFMHKIKSDKDDEVHFYIAKKRCRFGRTEFALVTGLNLLRGPTEAEVSERATSDRLIVEYFNGDPSISIGRLRSVFESCTEKDDCYKLGLVLFVMGVLTGKEEKNLVPPFIIRMVEDLPFFYNYPWGKISFNLLKDTWSKDFVQKKKHMDEKIVKGTTQKESKYSAYGYAVALQYWAYESILELAEKFAIRRSHRFPRMVNWESKDAPLGKEEVIRLFAKKLTVYSVLCPRSNEAEFLSHVTGGEAPLFVDMEELVIGDDGQPTQDSLRSQASKLALTLEQRAEEAGIFRDDTPPHSPPSGARSVPPSASMPDSASMPQSASIPSTSQPQVPISSAILARLERVEKEQLALKQGQTDILKGQNEIMGYLKTTAKLLWEIREGPAQRPNDEEDVLRTPQNMSVTSIGDTQDSEVQVLETVPTPVEKRTKKRPRWFDEYTEMKKKMKPSTTNVNVDPLRPVDEKLLHSFRNWLVGTIGNKYPRDVFTGLCGVAWFSTLNTDKLWLSDDHLDAAFHMMRRRQHFFPELYPRKCTVMPSWFTSSLRGRWDAWKSNTDHDGFVWDESILELLRGDPNQFLPSWKGMECIYMSMFLNRPEHWIAMEVNLELWKIFLFDSSLGSLTKDELNSLMDVWCPLLAKLVDQCGVCDTHYMVMVPQMTASESQVRPFDWEMMDNKVVPQTKSSGDCGMYVIEHIEHKLLDLPFDGVHDQHMSLFRQRWAVDLFYQNLA
ncbi:uncharacterized protein LOC133034581 [Cannabis sativa]|uniref:uncharacterized protein LOC133034581 n=2 Tax=Cannabis sativa TaxID=3483 RepID=UPI0029CA5D08|nr:uncharacterized protein LOC133034581 [Cannabis sativa]